MHKFWQKIREKSGISLVEIMISVFIISIGVTGSLAYFTAAKSATRLARDTTTATAHGEYILEEMRALSTQADITANDWAAFISAQSLDTLDNEAIQIAYVDQDADPLNITITVNWTTNTRARSISLVTELTK